jgi:hypothetical protein
MVQPGGPVPPAYAVMSSLLDVIVERVAPMFRVAEIEGDAVFAYALDDPGRGVGAEPLLGVVRSAYRGFRERIDEAMVVHKHACQACFLLPSLELKFVLHHGDFVIQPIAGQARVIGPSVNVAHRLLKNTVPDATGHRAYLFMTDDAARRLGIAAGVGIDHVERYADIGEVPGQVVALNAA